MEVIGGLLGILIISGMIGLIIIAGWTIIKLVFNGLIRIIYFIFFRGKQKKLEKERYQNIQKLKDMGVEVFSDTEESKNYTSIR